MLNRLPRPHRAPARNRTNDNNAYLPDVAILDVSPRTDCGGIAAFVTMRLNGILLYDAKLLRCRDGSVCFVPPSSSWTDAKGRVTYDKVIKWPYEWDGYLLALVLEIFNPGGNQDEN